MLRTRTILILAATLAPISEAAAQDFTPRRLLGSALLDPGTTPPPLVLRCVAGEFTQDARPDAAILVGGVVHLVWAPGGYEALPAIATGASGLAAVRGIGSLGGDGLVSLGAAGLRKHVFQPSAGTFAETTVGSGAWIGASRLGSADLDTAGADDVFALTTGGTGVVMLTGLAGASPQETSFTLPAPANDLRAVDWVGTPAREIAVLTGTTVTIHRLGGLTVAGFGLAGPVSAWTVLRRTATGSERLAFVVRSGGQDVLQVAAHGTALASYPLGAQGVVTLAARDIDLDGDDDLIATRSSSGHALLLYRQADGSFFLGTGGSGEIDLGAGPAAGDPGTAGIAFADFDGDGDHDLLAPVPALDALSLVENRLLDAALARPGLSARAFVENLDSGAVHVELELQAPAVTLAGATHVELTAWRQTQAANGPQRVAFARVLVPGGSWPLTTNLDFDNLAGAELLHEIEARQVVADAAGDVITAAPSSFACFSVSLPLLEAFAVNLGLPYASIVVFVPYFTLPMVPGGGDSRLDTGIVPLGDVPKFEDDPEDKVPDPKPDG